MDEINIKSAVRQHYADIAGQADGCGCGPDCCSSDGNTLISLAEIDQLRPETIPGADLGLSCGFPVHFAGLIPGEVVLDLGSGAGVDVFAAAQRVGQTGKAIGVDMTPEMIDRARRNAQVHGITNVEFRLGEIEALPVADASIDVVISNCVINLAPDKQRVFAEIARVLKPGGRFIVSDMVTQGEVPAAVRADPLQWAGCVAGASEYSTYLEFIQHAGFGTVKELSRSGGANNLGSGWQLLSVTLEGRKG